MAKESNRESAKDLREELLFENQNLKNEIHELKKKLYRNTEIFRENSEKIKLLKLMREKYESKDFMSSVEQQKNEIERMKALENENEKEIHNLRVTMCALDAEFKYKKKIVCDLMTESSNLHRELEGYRQETKELAVKADETKEQYDTMSEEKRKLSNQLDILRTAIAKRDKCVHKIRSDLSNVERQKKELLEEEKELENQMQNYKADIAKLIQDVALLRKENKSLEKERPVLLTRVDRQRALLRDENNVKKKEGKTKRFFGLF